MGKATGKDDAVIRGKAGLLVPDEVGGLAEDIGEDVDGIALAIATREYDDPEAHPASRPARRLILPIGVPPPGWLLLARPMETGL